MTQREQLMEQYEDILFALLMNDLMEVQGAAALEENERLKADPAAAVPLEIQRRCIRTINHCFAKQTRRAAGRACYIVFRKVAVAALVAILLFSTAFAASPALRRATLNFAMQTFMDHTDFWLDSSSEFTGATEFENYEIQASWLPAGFAFSDSSKDNRGMRALYTDKTGAELEIQVFWKTDMKVSADTENAKLTQISINGGEGLLIEKNNTSSIIWADKNNRLMWLIWSSDVSADDVVETAKNLQLVEQ